MSENTASQGARELVNGIMRQASMWDLDEVSDREQLAALIDSHLEPLLTKFREYWSASSCSERWTEDELDALLEKWKPGR